MMTEYLFAISEEIGSSENIPEKDQLLPCRIGF
jgi:hypothetical protein